ncbi:MAG: hypothetical protein K6F69_05145 [Treponema sp.]|nr:hypothetical protein [Treponema sp.]
MEIEFKDLSRILKICNSEENITIVSPEKLTKENKYEISNTLKELEASNKIYKITIKLAEGLKSWDFKEGLFASKCIKAVYFPSSLIKVDFSSWRTFSKNPYAKSDVDLYFPSFWKNTVDFEKIDCKNIKLYDTEKTQFEAGKYSISIFSKGLYRTVSVISENEAVKKQSFEGDLLEGYTNSSKSYCNLTLSISNGEKCIFEGNIEDACSARVSDGKYNIILSPSVFPAKDKIPNFPLYLSIASIKNHKKTFSLDSATGWNISDLSLSGFIADKISCSYLSTNVYKYINTTFFTGLLLKNKELSDWTFRDDGVEEKTLYFAENKKCVNIRNEEEEREEFFEKKELLEAEEKEDKKEEKKNSKSTKEIPLDTEFKLLLCMKIIAAGKKQDEAMKLAEQVLSLKTESKYYSFAYMFDLAIQKVAIGIIKGNGTSKGWSKIFKNLNEITEFNTNINVPLDNIEDFDEKIIYKKHPYSHKLVRADYTEMINETDPNTEKIIEVLVNKLVEQGKEKSEAIKIASKVLKAAVPKKSNPSKRDHHKCYGYMINENEGENNTNFAIAVVNMHTRAVISFLNNLNEMPRINVNLALDSYKTVKGSSIYKKNYDKKLVKINNARFNLE